jgi:hypothetical protein
VDRIPAAWRNGTVGAKRNASSQVAPTERPAKALSNIEIVTLAIYLLGGQSRFVDTEDIAVKANEIAPGRFTWVKYTDQINIHTIKTHLWDAKSERKGALLLGSEKEGWMLSSSGYGLARTRAEALGSVKGKPKRISRADEKWIRSERVRMLNSEAYRKFRTLGVGAVSREEAEGFFRLNSYVMGEARKRKISRIRNTFGGDADLGRAVTMLAASLEGEDNHA